jgi:hypothetical protein
MGFSPCRQEKGNRVEKKNCERIEGSWMSRWPKGFRKELIVGADARGWGVGWVQGRIESRVVRGEKDGEAGGGEWRN